MESYHHVEIELRNYGNKYLVNNINIHCIIIVDY
jgi:hypothetical protein